MATPELKRSSLNDRLLLCGAMFVLCTNAWAVSGECTYPVSANAGGSGIGGTGKPANESGIGGTGISGNDLVQVNAELAGNVIFSQGKVEAQHEGRSRPLGKGASVCVGETIVTAQGAQAQIRMADGGMISMRPDTVIRINAFHFNGKEDGTERSEIALLQGRFRALTGTVGHTHKDNYAIQTPNAYIGIRGTDHEPVYIPNPAPGQKAAGVPGTYDKVNSGGVVIRTPQGSVEVRPNQVGFAPVTPLAPPVLLKELPKFYHDIKGAAAHEGNETAGQGQSGKELGEHAPEPAVAEPKAPEVNEPEVPAPELHVPEVHVPE
jgi:hypothetical protein